MLQLFVSVKFAIDIHYIAVQGCALYSGVELSVVFLLAGRWQATRASGRTIHFPAFITYLTSTKQQVCTMYLWLVTTGAGVA